MPDKQYMTPEDAARIQSAMAKSGGDMGFASRAQSAGAQNINSGAVQRSSGGKQGNPGGANATSGKK
ncbi:hypothetical protein VMCG_00370 [Cytospora schulzeri]|uniref:Uncharacterized protein n=1 Tax=Cytospora schulzeri TaxID=448051 RepID=A0A423X9S5_9PEZI|nr:hypothetical protein VMCG_00370 [Valsa malicola]